MDAFDTDHNVIIMRADNTNAFPKIKKLLRGVEILVILVYLTSAIVRLPSAVKFAGDYFRRLALFVVSPLFIFLIGNIIVLILFFNSRNQLPQHDGDDEMIDRLITADFNFCPELTKNVRGERSTPLARTGQRCEKNVFRNKEAVSEVKTESASEVCRPEGDKGCNNCGGRRRRRVLAAAAGGGRQVEGLSNEEFKRAIEGFIARQINFHRQEQLAIVVHRRVGNCY
ncbi:Unknown protein [Striga hermonthica]|uniref:DUF4408 domain-containing protein n=1 Tax=Striga hermonthica TaxID=68872 RepID=A0A9N7N791_STRHE|nr:Unknown protein [Striga hermonthica]